MLKQEVVKLIKEILFNSPLKRYFFPRYSYNFTPSQLCFFCQCIEDTRYYEGPIAEIGCASGETTLFLNKYMDTQNIEKRYYAIDTFSGFPGEDIEFEVVKRGKTKDLFTGFQANKKKWFDDTMYENNIKRVLSIETDVNKYDLKNLGCLSFALLDVDLYRPMIKILKESYEILTPGGLIVVDDCDPQNTHWDGSDQAYKEFMKEISQPIEIVYEKLGIVRKHGPTRQ